MKFVYLPQFVKKLKYLVKKYPSFKEDFEALLEKLQQHPQMGTSLGKNCYKIRLAITSKTAGKSGGARVITCIKIEQGNLFFLTVYDKSEQQSVSDEDLRVLINYIQQDFSD